MRTPSTADLAFGFALALIALGLPGAAMAHSYKLGNIEIGHIWAPPPKAGIDGVAVYGPLFNEGKKLQTLVAVSSPEARTARFRLVRDGVESWPAHIELHPGKPVSLAAWGPHIWLSGLKKAVKKGDWINLTLDFGPAGKLAVKALVQNSASE